ncbi:dihydrofolate reductase-like [Tropilaelaps mercedesae]|uniref:dihydrofolate reductase n=1 Tax=Tropilaelaps mercedesae TaxID=418985 RepID=A0A1V9XVS5_9ACAR|nr:dihydrofolate reductase-like [Tropilaelaps mercedesae]
MSALPLCVVVAMCKTSKGIGHQGSLPWGSKLPKEMKHFARVTTQTSDPNKCNAVIMGRRTWESIPEKRKPLPRRFNIVISSTLSQDSVPNDVQIARSFEEALELAQNIRRPDKAVERIMVIGGTQVYEEAVRHRSIDTVYLTEILAEFECDTFLNLDETKFADVYDVAVSKDEQEENGIHYRYRVLKKIV